jgi:hypothetical protein
LLGDPIGMIGSSLGLPDPSLLEGIGSQIPIPGLDTTLGEIKLFFEVAGVIIGVLTANPVLACACSKLLVHDGLHRLALAMMRDVAHDFNSTPPDQRKLMTRESQSSSLDILVRSAEPRLTFDAGSNAMTGPSTWVTDPAPARRTQPAGTQSAGGTRARSGGPGPAAARRTQPAGTQSAGGTRARSGGPRPAPARRSRLVVCWWYHGIRTWCDVASSAKVRCGRLGAGVRWHESPHLARSNLQWQLPR